MKYALVKDGKVVDGPRGLPTSWGNISGLNRLTDQELVNLGWLPWKFVEVPSPGPDYIQTASTIDIKTYEIVETQAYRAKTEAEKEEERQQQIENAKENRAQAYREESDPLFFKTQRGEATMEEWLAKVQEIKQLFPY